MGQRGGTAYAVRPWRLAWGADACGAWCFVDVPTLMTDERGLQGTAACDTLVSRS